MADGSIPLAGTTDGRAVRGFTLFGNEYKRGDKIPRGVLAKVAPLNYRGMINGGLVDLELDNAAVSIPDRPTLQTIESANYRELKRLARLHSVALRRTDKTVDVRRKLRLAFDY